jgi:hypothetical protein
MSGASVTGVDAAADAGVEVDAAVRGRAGAGSGGDAPGAGRAASDAPAVSHWRRVVRWR